MLLWIDFFLFTFLSAEIWFLSKNNNERDFFVEYVGWFVTLIVETVFLYLFFFSKPKNGNNYWKRTFGKRNMKTIRAVFVVIFSLSSLLVWYNIFHNNIVIVVLFYIDIWNSHGFFFLVFIMALSAPNCFGFSKMSLQICYKVHQFIIIFPNDTIKILKSWKSRFIFIFVEAFKINTVFSNTFNRTSLRIVFFIRNDLLLFTEIN